MQLPIIFRPTTNNSLPPMYTWPRYIKRTLLVLSVLAVITAYVLLAGGVVFALAILADAIGG